MFEKLTAKVEQQATEATQRAIRMTESVWSEFPNVLLHRKGDELVISGRGLMRCWLGDARLRFALWKNR